METTEHTSRPFCRATIVDDSVTLNQWQPGLLSGGPAMMALEELAERGVTLADLVRIDEDELIVRVLRGSAYDDSAVAALTEWAATVGYRRLWLPDRVIDLADEPARTGTASVRCPTCRIEWRDSTLEFWETVREDGWFPGYCCACGGSLPEWGVVDEPMSGLRSPDGPDVPAVPARGRAEEPS